MTRPRLGIVPKDGDRGVDLGYVVALRNGDGTYSPIDTHDRVHTKWGDACTELRAARASLPTLAKDVELLRLRGWPKGRGW